MHNIQQQCSTDLTHHQERHQCNQSNKGNQNYISFGGYASVFGVIDKNRDVVMRGAFQRSIVNAIDNIKLLWQHDLNEPIGYISHMEEDEIGLYVKGMIIDNSTDKDLTKALQHKLVDNLSIGYTIVLESPNISIANCIESGALSDKFNTINTSDENQMESDVRLIHDLELVEISLVSIPCNNYAKIIETKALPTQQSTGSDDGVGVQQQPQTANTATTTATPTANAGAGANTSGSGYESGSSQYLSVGTQQSEQSVAPQVASSLSEYLKSIICNLQNGANTAGSSGNAVAGNTDAVNNTAAQPTSSTAAAPTNAASGANAAAPTQAISTTNATAPTNSNGVSSFNTQSAIEQINAIEARLNSLMQYMEEYPSV